MAQLSSGCLWAGDAEHALVFGLRKTRLNFLYGLFDVGFVAQAHILESQVQIDEMVAVAVIAYILRSLANFGGRTLAQEVEK